MHDVKKGKTKDNFKCLPISIRLGMRPWIAVAYSAPVAAAMAVFLIYPIGQVSFSDEMLLGKKLPRLYDKLRYGKSLYACFTTPKVKKLSRVERKLKSETCLNEKSLCTRSSKSKDNFVPNRTLTCREKGNIIPPKQPGLYSILCIANDWRYYGESSNVSGRLASHRSMLCRKIHPNQGLQNDFNMYGFQHFSFQVLYIGSEWAKRDVRLGKETELIVLDRSRCYNILEDIHTRPHAKNPFWGRLHTPETKRRISQALKNPPSHILGVALSVKGKVYPSYSEASRQTGISRKTLRKKVKDPNVSDFFLVKHSGKV